MDLKELHGNTITTSSTYKMGLAAGIKFTEDMAEKTCRKPFKLAATSAIQFQMTNKTNCGLGYAEQREVLMEII